MSDVEHARETFEALWPDRDVRRAVGSLLVDSIRFAHSHGSACWEVTLFDDRVSLNTDPIQVLTLRNDEASIYVRAPLTIPKRLRIRLHPEQPFYAAVPVPSALCWVPAENIDRLPTKFREAHLALVADAALRRRSSTWKKHHSSGTIDYLEGLLGTVVPRPSYAQPEPTPDPTQEASLGGGYGNTVTNKEVERAAVDFVTRSYEEQGWLVDSVESERCGFDLLCRKGRKIARVEVKGSTGSALQFILTAAEFRRAREDQRFVLAWVRDALSPTPQLEQWSSKSFLEDFDIQACQYWAKAIQR
jgi:Domain of unknown function (DUF3883)